MPVCQQCSTAIAFLTRQLGQSLQQNPDLKKAPDYRLEQFDLKRTKSCWICARFLKWLETEHPEELENHRKHALVMEFSALGCISVHNTATKRFVYEVDMTVTIKGFSRDLDSCQFHVNLIPAEGDFSLYVADQVLINQELPKFDPAASSNRNQRSILLVAMQWITQCQSKHKQCSSKNSSWYPTRLLHVDRVSKKVKLIITKNHQMAGHYLSLSHRWPKIETVKLLYSTIDQFQTEISTATLPQSFQDAIAITHHLDFEYLWIDSLCISQDKDLKDWTKESKLMDQVYSNAFLNISATMASDGTESLFQKRLPSPVAPQGVSLFSQAEQDYYIVDSQLWLDEIDSAPLNKRAWVYQERFLAQRILHFGTRQLGWECHELDALELFPEGMHELTKVSDTNKSSAFRIFNGIDAALNSSEFSEQTFVHLFHTLVGNYSACQITKTTDKLIAFEGLMKKLQRRTADSYFAGIWNRFLPFDLCWYCVDDTLGRNHDSKQDFLAPSWSWASSSGRVQYSYYKGKPVMLISDWSFFKRRVYKKYNYIDNTSIQLCGFLFPFTAQFIDGHVCHLKILEVEYDEADLDEPDGLLVVFDNLGIETIALCGTERQVFWLPLFATTTDMYGIVVTKRSNSFCYERLGLVRIPIVKYLQDEISVPHGRVTRGTKSMESNIPKTDERSFKARRFFEYMAQDDCRAQAIVLR